jgi:methionyl-tRNA synthetase
MLVHAEQWLIPTEGVTRCECGAKYWDGTKCASCGETYKPHDLLVSGTEYRTAISLEKRGHVFVRYQGPARGWLKLRTA